MASAGLGVRNFHQTWWERVFGYFGGLNWNFIAVAAAHGKASSHRPINLIGLIAIRASDRLWYFFRSVIRSLDLHASFAASAINLL